jgi:hypothetical protein
MLDHAGRKPNGRQRRVQGIVVRNGRDAAQQVLDAAVQQTTVARGIDHGPERGVGARAQADLRNPFPHVAKPRAMVERRETVELQVVVGVDQARQQSIAREIHDPVRRLRVAAHRRDPRFDHPHRGCSAIARRHPERRIDEGDSARRCVGHAACLLAWTTITSGVPC